MKREIKFRVWHSVNKIMFANKDISVLAKNIESNNVWLYMQYTGLKDKNGIEIFEGDFIKLHEYGEDVYKEVVFHDGAFCVHGFNWERKSAEVIGNKYQNPELV